MFILFWLSSAAFCDSIAHTVQKFRIFWVRSPVQCFFLREIEAGSPKRERWAHHARSGSKSEFRVCKQHTSVHLLFTNLNLVKRTWPNDLDILVPSTQKGKPPLTVSKRDELVFQNFIQKTLNLTERFYWLSFLKLDKNTSLIEGTISLLLVNSVLFTYGKVTKKNSLNDTWVFASSFLIAKRDQKRLNWNRILPLKLCRLVHTRAVSTNLFLSCFIVFILLA